MRPIKLVIQGLRSYRQRQEIEFPEGLFAITGQTGSGKSSILEAIVFALYGSSTFEGSNNRVLLGDRCDEMLVSLEFQIQKQRYRVTRSLTAKTASHELQGPDGQLVATKAQDVNAKIEQLLGLTRDDFLKTVVLPQGAFQNFLHSTPAKRAELLKNLLELSVLDQIQEEVSQQRSALQSELSNLQTLRQSLPPDPQLGIKTVDGLLEISQSEIARHKLLLQTHQALNQVLSEHRLTSQRLQANLEQIRTAPSFRQPAEEHRAEGFWSALAELGPQLSREISQLGEQLKALSSQQLGLYQSLQAKRSLLNLQHQKVRRANQLQSLVSEMSARAERFKDEANAAQIERDGLEGLSKSKSVQLVLVEEQWASLREQRQQGQQRFSKLQAELAQAEQVQAQRKALDAEIADCETSLAGAVEKLTPLQEQLVQAKVEVESWQQQFTTSQNEVGIAALCQHLSGGDSCPVCQTVLPPDWKNESTEQLSNNLKRVEAQLLKSTNAAQQLERKRTEISVECQQLERRLAKLQTTSSQNLDFPDLAKLGQQLDEQRLALLHDEQQLELSSAQLHQLRAECQAEKQRIAAVQKRLLELTTQISQSEKQLGPNIQELELIRTDLASQRSPGFTEPSDPLDSSWLDQLHQELEHEQLALEAEEAQLQAEQLRQSQLQQQLNQSQARFRDQWIHPLEDRLAAMKTLQQLCQLLGPESSQVDIPQLQAQLRTSELGAEGLALLAKLQDAWSQTVQRMQQIERDLLGQINTVAQALEAAERQQKELLSLGGPQTLEELAEHLEDLHREHGQLQAERNQLEAQKLQASELDLQLAPLQERVMQLTALAELLGNKAGKNKRTSFSQWLLQQRQEQLIYLASDFLKKFSHGQFGFDPDFQIQDMSTGNSRKTNTLSGGETFLASLALALALSELVSRKGGRLEAFFIDEGFGSLSPECLDRALSALETIAQSGRTIGVISHVSVMAERIEQVWIVTKTPMGSQIQIVSEEIRRRLLDEDLKQLQSLALPLFS